MWGADDGEDVFGGEAVCGGVGEDVGVDGFGDCDACGGACGCVFACGEGDVEGERRRFVGILGVVMGEASGSFAYGLLER